MKNEDDRRSIMKALSLFSQLGLTMAGCIIIGVLIGKNLDQYFGTSPWLLLVFIVIGTIAAFKLLYDIAIKEWRVK